MRIPAAIAGRPAALLLAAAALAGCGAGSDGPAATSDRMPTAVPGEILHLPAAAGGRAGMVTAKIGGIPAKVVGIDEEGGIAILAPSRLRRAGETEVLVSREGLPPRRVAVRVAPPPYVRLVLAMEKDSIRLVSAEAAAGAPPPGTGSRKGGLLAVTLFDTGGKVIHRALLPFPGKDGVEIHGRTKRGNLARRPAGPVVYFSIKVPRLADEFTVQFATVGATAGARPALRHPPIRVSL